ncbi:hypothetical protein BDV33DRAFT_185005 [Aspergillus novoparasiticus]|uniref:Uncharacterized protein n=1 Tax=Aspergillus novoparasiticus TaxID=986946 RepID=A0A5N6E7G8_9EURO|nr:hypothetical protein BDV33DRAFT_185005 [Aspergillus novoparasiticus]
MIASMSHDPKHPSLAYHLDRIFIPPLNFLTRSQSLYFFSQISFIYYSLILFTALWIIRRNSA